MIESCAPAAAMPNRARSLPPLGRAPNELNIAFASVGSPPAPACSSASPTVYGVIAPGVARATYSPGLRPLRVPLKATQFPSAEMPGRSDALENTDAGATMSGVGELTLGLY